MAVETSAYGICGDAESIKKCEVVIGTVKFNDINGISQTFIYSIPVFPNNIRNYL